MTKEEFEKVIVNMNFPDADVLGSKYGFYIRALTVDGVAQFGTMDYNINRLNVAIKTTIDNDYYNGSIIISVENWG